MNNNPLTGNLEWDLDTQISTMVPKAVKQLTSTTSARSPIPRSRAGSTCSSPRTRRPRCRPRSASATTSPSSTARWSPPTRCSPRARSRARASFASTGDNGYACPEVASTGVPEGPPGVSWPADGEYTTAVGGTTLLADSSGNVQNEIAWIGGGGGSLAVGDRCPRGRCRRTPPVRPGSSRTRAAAASPTSRRSPTATRRTSSTEAHAGHDARRASAARASPAR